MSLKKSEILYKEALKDIEIRNYNKAASAIYFSIRRELEDAVLKIQNYIPRRDDKLANVLKHLGFEEESELFMDLYELRKKADYLNENVSKDEVLSALKKYEKILSAIKRLNTST